jgi:hypothetical protein
MTRLPFHFVLAILSTCACATAQIPLPLFDCQEIDIGLLPVHLEILPDGLNPSILPPGFPDRVVLGVVVNGQTIIRNFAAGTYFGADPCSVTSGAFTATFSVPVTITITGSGQQLTYVVSVPDFATSFNLGAPGNLSLSLQGATRGPLGIFSSFAQLVSSGGRLVLSPTQSPTPLPPSIILTLTGLAGAGMVTMRRKRYFI